MLNIAICDDCHEQLDVMRKAIEQYIITQTVSPIKVVCFDNPFLLLEKVTHNGGYDILLLDIFMPGINGIEVAKEIRRRKDKTEIIFLTTSDDFAVVAFALKAVHYLVKPFTQNEINDAMDRAVATFMKSRVQKMSYKLTGGGVKTVNIDDILYIESYKHEQQVHLKDREVLSIREGLKSLQEELDKLSPHQFLSPYKGFIVNQKAVHAIEPSCMKLYGNISIPIARRSYRELTDKYFTYSFGGNDS